MAFDERLAQRVIEWFGPDPAISTKKMFGGLCVLHHGNMALGILGDELMVRVGPDAYEASLRLTGAREMDFTKRPLRGMVMVAPDVLVEDHQLDAWISLALGFVGGLPPKAGGKTGRPGPSG